MQNQIDDSTTEINNEVKEISEEVNKLKEKNAETDNKLGLIKERIEMSTVFLKTKNKFYFIIFTVINALISISSYVAQLFLN